MIERTMFLPDVDNPNGAYPLKFRQPIEDQDDKELDEQWHGDSDGTVGLD